MLIFAIKLNILSTIISITAIASISPLGNASDAIWENYLNENHCFSEHILDHKKTFVATLDANSEQVVGALRESDNKYKSLDKSVLYAMAASRRAMQNAGWTSNDVFGINIGSSRGATDLFENIIRSI